jgi:DNA-binding PadR family transcriptional regulator
MVCYPRRRVVPMRLLALALYWGVFRFQRGPGGPWGPRGSGRGSGPGFGGRRFGRGDLKYVILDLLQGGPRHGYDIIRAIEERFHGFYSPSPGSVYPTLQLLEDQGYVTGNERDGKKVYTITDAGRAFLKERSDTVDDVRARMAHNWGHKMGPEMRDVIDEVRQLGQTMFAQGAAGGFRDPEKMRRLREVVARARRDIEAIFRGESGSDETMV